MKPTIGNWPEIQTPTYFLNITTNVAGGNATITIDPGQKILIQNNVVIDTTGRTDTTFTVGIPAAGTDTYHLRFSLNGRAINNYIPSPNSFYLVNVNDANYNPLSLPEDTPDFDTYVDDLLCARIDVDSGGTVTVYPVHHKRDMRFQVLNDRTINTFPADIIVPFSYRWRHARLMFNYRAITVSPGARFQLSTVNWNNVNSGHSFFVDVGTTTLAASNGMVLDSIANIGGETVESEVLITRTSLSDFFFRVISGEVHATNNSNYLFCNILASPLYSFDVTNPGLKITLDLGTAHVYSMILEYLD